MQHRYAIVILIVLLGLTSLSGSVLKQSFTPPKIILAEEKARDASEELLNGQYLEAVRAYEQALPRIPTNTFHKRMYGRALAHVGLWEDAARNFQQAAMTEKIQVAVESDQKRLRGLQRGKEPDVLGDAVGKWEMLSVKYAQNMGVGAVAVLEDGSIVTAHPISGIVSFWTESGSRKAAIEVGGRPVALVAAGMNVWVTDFLNNRLLRISAMGIDRQIDLDRFEIHGARSASMDKDGFLWVADYGGGRVIHVSPNGDFVTQIGGGRLSEPLGVYVTENEIIVAEAGASTVRAFDRNGRYLRSYSHREMTTPAYLAGAGDGFLVQDKAGKIFRENDGELEGPLRSPDGTLVTSSLGIALDRWSNLWWGDGVSLRVAQRLPASRPYHFVEVVRSEYTQEGFLNLVVSAMTNDGQSIRNLDDRSFRLLRADKVIAPLAVRNLSLELKGRRIMIARESSLPMEEHGLWLDEVWQRMLKSLTAEDRTAVMDIADTYEIYRSFVVSPDLVGRALRETRQPAATIDLRNFAALDYAVRLMSRIDHARALVWLTSGEGIRAEELRLLNRMAVINQVPFFVIHVAETRQSELSELARSSGGAYYRLYADTGLEEFFEKLAGITSGRYRLAARLRKPHAHERGMWFPYTIESYYRDEVAFDQMGFYAP